MSHKYGIEVPASAEHSHEIYRKNRNDFWRKAIKDETHAAGVAFEIIDEKYKVHHG